MAVLFQQVQFHLNIDQIKTDGAFSDAVLVTDGQRISTHRLILASASNWLAQIMREHSDSEEVCIVLPDISQMVVRNMLDLLYNGQKICDISSINATVCLLNLLGISCNSKSFKICMINDNSNDIELPQTVPEFAHCIAGDESEDSGINELCLTSSLALNFKNEMAQEQNQVFMPISLSATCNANIELSENTNLNGDTRSNDGIVSSDVNESELPSADNYHRNNIENEQEDDVTVSKVVTPIPHLLAANKKDAEPKEVCKNKRYNFRTRRSCQKSIIKESCHLSPMSDDDPDFETDPKCNVSKNSRIRTEENYKNHNEHNSGTTIRIKSPRSKFLCDNIKCRFCDERFSSDDKRLNHEVKTHNVCKKFPYQCDRCDEKFKRPRMLQAHSKIHDYGKIVYPCKLCYKVFETQKTLMNHVEIHKSKLCRYCDKFVNTTLEVHYKRCIERAKMLSTETLSDTDRSSSTKSRNKVKAVGDVKGTRGKCNVCGIVVDRSAGLKRHLSRTHGIRHALIHKCPKCERRFSAKTELNLHMIAHNPNQLKYKCTYCEEYLASKAQRSTHYARQHPETEKNCMLCNIAMPRRLYKKHHAAMHQKPWQCDICGKSFDNAVSIWLHKKTHLKPSEWKYKCDQCEKPFKRRDALQLHLLVMHTDRSLMPHKCSFCPAGFAHKSRLDVHLRKHKVKK